MSHSSTNPRSYYKGLKYRVVRATRVNIFSKAAMLLIATLTRAEKLEICQLQLMNINVTSNRLIPNILLNANFMREKKVVQRKIAIEGIQSLTNCCLSALRLCIDKTCNITIFTDSPEIILELHFKNFRC